jgi:hypothetical protein
MNLLVSLIYALFRVEFGITIENNTHHASLMFYSIQCTPSIQTMARAMLPSLYSVKVLFATYYI